MKTVTSEVITVRLSESELKQILTEWASKKLQFPLKEGNIKFVVHSGDPGGYGSYGDPAHVYNPPTPASFGHVEIKYEKIKEIEI